MVAQPDDPEVAVNFYEVQMLDPQMLRQIAKWEVQSLYDLCPQQRQSLQSIVRLLSELNGGASLLGIIWYQGWDIAIVYTDAKLLFFQYVDEDMLWHVREGL